MLNEKRAEEVKEREFQATLEFQRAGGHEFTEREVKLARFAFDQAWTKAMQLARLEILEHSTKGGE